MFSCETHQAVDYSIYILNALIGSNNAVYTFRISSQTQHPA